MIGLARLDTVAKHYTLLLPVYNIIISR